MRYSLGFLIGSIVIGLLNGIPLPGFLFLLGLIPLLIGCISGCCGGAGSQSGIPASNWYAGGFTQNQNWRRHLPVGLFLLGLASLVFASGGPVAIPECAHQPDHHHPDIDVSGSMRSARISAQPPPGSRGSCLSPLFQHQKSTTQIGLVAFSTFAEIIQPAPPTRPRFRLRWIV